MCFPPLLPADGDSLGAVLSVSSDVIDLLSSVGSVVSLIGAYGSTSILGNSGDGTYMVCGPGYGGGGLSGMSELVDGVDVVEIIDNGL